jgi:hypothetical protein
LGPSTIYQGSNDAPINGKNAAFVALSNNLDTAVFRFECRKSVEIKITPLILPVAVLLEEQMEMEVSVMFHFLSSFDEYIFRRL